MELTIEIPGRERQIVIPQAVEGAYGFTDGAMYLSFFSPVDSSMEHHAAVEELEEEPTVVFTKHILEEGGHPFISVMLPNESIVYFEDDL